MYVYIHKFMYVWIIISQAVSDQVMRAVASVYCPQSLPSCQASTSRKVGVWLAWGLTGGNHRRTNEGSDLCRAGAKQGEALLQ